MRLNFNADQKYFFQKNAILIVEQNGDIFLVGPEYKEIEKLSAAEAFAFHLVKQAKAFNFSIIENAFIQKRATSSPQDKIFLIKTLNKFHTKGIIKLEEDSVKKTAFPQFEIEYTFQSALEKQETLIARTYSNQAAYEWALSLSFQLEYFPKLYKNGLFYGADFNSSDLCFQTIDQKIPRIANLLEKLLPDDSKKPIWPKRERSREYLWKLHQIFEDFYAPFLAPDIYKSTPEITELCEELRHLNYLIHMAEDGMEEWEGGFIETIFEHHTKPVLLSPDAEIDKLFSPDLIENTVYLNYFQIGYSYMAAFEAGTDSIPVPQKNYCANHFIYLRPSNPLSGSRKKNLAKWLKDKHGKNFDDSSLRLGHIPLAKIMGTESYKEIIQRIGPNQNLQGLKLRPIKKMPRPH